MTDDEKASLRLALARLVARRRKFHPNNIIKTAARLDDDSSQFYTTKAEILVFDLPENELHKLHVARMAYEVFIDIAHDGLSDEVQELLLKARSICPPVSFCGQEFPFRTRWDHVQFFQWLSKEFMQIPHRASHAFWHKHHFNLMRLTIFEDERRINV